MFNLLYLHDIYLPVFQPSPAVGTDIKGGESTESTERF